MRDHLLFYLNGEPRVVRGEAAFSTLTEYLRDELRLVGTKVVCAEGDCGACSVLIGRPGADRLEYLPIDACITFLHQLDASHVVTVEGLAHDGRLHPVQQAMVDGYGSQCGFCTPGIVVTLAGHFEARAESCRHAGEAASTLREASPAKSHGSRIARLPELKQALTGNLCRCTGYAQILESAAALDGAVVPRLAERYPEPAMLDELRAAEREAVRIEAPPRRLLLPVELADACRFKAEHPDCAVVAGATDVAVRRNKGAAEPASVLGLGRRLPRFDDVTIDGDVLRAGAGATWSRLLDRVADRVPELAEILERFGAPQIRNAATIGGNLANASPIADSLPFLYVAGAVLELRGPEGSRRLRIESFYRGYKQLDLGPGELIAAVEVPLPGRGDALRLYKMSRRRALDISTFTAAILVRRAGAGYGDGERSVDPGTIASARLAYGGVGPVVLRLPRAEAFLAGRPFTLETFRRAGEIAAAETTPWTDVRGSERYRRRLAEDAPVKFFHDVTDPVGGRIEPLALDRAVPRIEIGAAARREPPHESARGHVTGTANYIEDLPRLERELVVDFVPSPIANGRLLAIDAAAARLIPGVAGVFTHADIPGHNAFGPIFADEPFLPSDRVSYAGQPVVVIAAETRAAARLARAAVRLELAEEPPVLSIEDADARGHYLGVERRIARGDLAAGWAAATLQVEGVFRSGGQEQFYLESQAALAWAGEGGELWVHSSTQNPSEIQTVVAEVLGRGQHQVVCLVRRMGGGFGGKETQAAIPALMAALVVDRTGRPARVVYGKDDDMRSTGKRHPYRTDYRVGCDREGRIVAAELRLLSNGGAFADLSTAVLERSMLHADNSYYLPAVEIRARVCRTNLPPNTAFRGFGGPQGMAVIETVMQEIAVRLGRDALDVRRANLYDANLGDPLSADSGRSLTPYGQVVRDFRVPEIFDRLERSARYRERAAAIATWNASSRTHLRGLAMTPVKFGISFTTKFLNQANALVQVLTDGTVQVSTGATEMGQGVQTKIAQLVADELGIDPSRVAALTTSTDRNANTAPTAASASTDLNGTAAVRAAAAIRERMAALAAELFAQGLSGSAAPPSGAVTTSRAPSPPLDPPHAAGSSGAPSSEDVRFARGQDIRFAAGEVFDVRDPERRMTFAALADRARRERVDLGARGFYATPGIDFDRESGRGSPFYYFTTGGAVAQVLIDRLTGELRVELLDVVMDAGEVLNHGIERGQCIGGVVQGIGWVTTEELVWSDRGELLSHSPTTYKIPDVDDLPDLLRFEFLTGAPNRHNLRSTKALGEPPLMLGLSVWAAVLDALSFVEPGEVPRLDLPATHEAILLAIAELERRHAPRPAPTLDPAPVGAGPVPAPSEHRA